MKTMKELDNVKCNRDIKLYFTCEYNKNNQLKFRENIPFDKNDDTHFQLDKNGKCYIIRRSKRGAIIGKCVPTDIHTAKIISVYLSNSLVTKDYDGFSSNPYDLIKSCNNSDNKVYVDKYFKIYYDLIEFCIEKYNRSYSKVTALKFYQLIRNLFNNDEKFKDNYFFSEPNCFILSNNKIREYDALILKKSSKKNLGFYPESDVLATIELKSGGFICKHNKIKEEMTKYMIKEARENIPHIYISLFENSKQINNRKTNFNKVIKGIELACSENIIVIPFVISTTDDNNYFMESSVCSIDKILDSLKK